MRRASECLLVLGIAMLAACAAIWYPWLALSGVGGLAVGFIFGNAYRAKLEKGRSKVIGVEIMKLRNFKTSIQALCDKLR
jgi:hypothetical protein